MGYDIGPRIGITGEREFNNQIQKINGRLKLLGSEMNLLTKKYDGNSDSLDFLQDKIRKYPFCQKHIRNRARNWEI